MKSLKKSSAQITITIVTETPMAISFSVNGESNIPSDGVDSVAVLPFSAKISYVAIPRMDPRVFLRSSARFRWHFVSLVAVRVLRVV
jgi:hypothetical protein